MLPKGRLVDEVAVRVDAKLGGLGRLAAPDSMPAVDRLRSTARDVEDARGASAVQALIADSLTDATPGDRGRRSAQRPRRWCGEDGQGRITEAAPAGRRAGGTSVIHQK